MLDNFKFTNHLGEVIQFGTDGLYANYSDLRDYLWNYDNSNNKISNFSRGVVTKSLPFVIACNSQEKATEIKNRIYEIADKDVVAGKPGTLTVEGYEMSCYIVGISKERYLVNRIYMSGKITIATDQPVWKKSQTFHFFSGNNESEGIDHSFDYPFDYGANAGGQVFLNPYAFDSDFILDIYGFVSSPKIEINGHVYQVNIDVRTDEIVQINSSQKTIFLTEKNGQKTNIFNYRYKPESIFEKIQSGYNKVVWDSSFGFDLTLLDCRSEPKWR